LIGEHLVGVECAQEGMAREGQLELVDSEFVISVGKLFLPPSLARWAMKRVVYVGEMALDPEERLAKHLAGGKRSSKWVRRFGVRLIPSLTEDLPEYDTVPESQAAERELGDRLRQGGYCVFGAH
jgi:hypothetical protein